MGSFPTNGLRDTMTQRYLDKVEDQTAYYMLGRQSFSFRFYPFRGLMYMDIARGDVDIVNGKRVLPNRWLLPEYVAMEVGNLRFETYVADGDDYVWWEDFNTKFRLMDYTADEFAEVRALEKEEDA